MSNLLKSKFLLGVMVVAVMFVGAFAFVSKAETASAATCSITVTLKVGSRGDQVKCLQAALDNGLVGDGVFGPKTKARVVAWQASMGLTADGIFGAKSRSAWMGGAVSGNFPAGCTSASGYSATTGAPCNSVMANTFAPAGCTSASGYSPVTGGACYAVSSNNPVNTGPVSVSLSSDNPASGTLVSSQAVADLAHFAFSGNGVVNSITLQRTGISSNTVFDSVYLYQGNVRVSESASVNNSGVVTFNGLNWSVNGSAVLSVRADINSSATSGTVGVTLTGLTTGAGAVTANVAGNVHSLVSSSGILGTVAIGSNTATATAVNAGTTQFTMWSAPITTGTHTMLLKSFALHFVGSAPNDALANIKLYIDGVPVSTGSTPNALGYIVFDFGSTPRSINTGSHTFDVRADVVKGSSRTIKLSLENRADLMMTDSQANINVASTGTIPSSSATVTISTGTVSVSVDPSFQSVTNVTGGATNVVIGKFKLHAYGEDVKVNHLYVKPTLAGQSSVAADGLNNVALYFCTAANNCSQVGSSQSVASGLSTPATALDFSLGSSMIVPAGVDSWVEVRADLTTNNENLSYVDGTIAVALTLSSGATASTSNNNAQGMNSLDSTIDVPSGSTTTSGLTIQTGLVAIATSSNMGTTSVSPNTLNAKVGSFIIQNQSTSEGVHITNLQVGLTVTTADSTNYSNLKTSEASGSGAIAINPTYAASTETSTNNFPVDFVLAPGATKTLDIFTDVGSASSGTLVTKLLVTATGASSNSSICSPSVSGGSVNGCNVGPGTSATGQTINVQAATFNNGGVVIGANSTTTVRYIAAGSTGATDASMATFNFKSTNGTTTISELKFRVTGSSTVSSIRVGNSTASVANGIVYLTGLSIVVPSTGSGVNVPVYMSYAPVGNNLPGTSGTESFVEMTYVKYQAGNTTSTLTGGQATNGGSGNTSLGTITSLTTAAIGSSASMTMASSTVAAQFQPGMIVAIGTSPATSIVEVQSVSAAVVTVVTLYGAGVNQAGIPAYFFSIPQNAAYASTVNNCPTMSDAGLTVAVGGTSGTDCMSVVGSKPSLAIVDSTALLSNAQVKLGSVKVTADSKGDIQINDLPISVTSGGNALVTTGTLVVKVGSDTVTTTDNTLVITVGGTTDTATISFTGGYNIIAGNSVTFDIYATASGTTGGNGDTLSMKLGSAGSLTWTDLAGNGSTAGETGTAIPDYPTESSVITD